MRKINSHWLDRIMAAVLFFSAAIVCDAATYYVHPLLGNDTNLGTSRELPIRTLERASELRLQAGDQLLLAAGQTFAGELSYDGLSGDVAHPIVISSYVTANGAGEVRATIDAKGFAAGVCLKNCAHVNLGNLQITANAGGMKTGTAAMKKSRSGILIEADQPGEFTGFNLTNLVVKDVFYEEPGFVRSPDEVKSANGTQNYGWGIRFLVNSPAARMKDIVITDCKIENVSHTGLKFSAPGNGLQNVEVQRVQVTGTGGPGVQMSGVQVGHFSHLDVNRSGSADDTRKWGRGSGLWTWGSSDVVIENSRFQNANGPGDSCGVHIDYNCRNVIVQYNLSAHNAGGFCEILGNDYNCAYRYNVSVNDGYRVKGRDGAFQAGKIFWLSGYTGSKNPHAGPYNTYFYNNTIYTGDDLVANVSVAPTAAGVLIANNIFYFQGHSELVAGDQERFEKRDNVPIANVVFENNLYLRPGNWPANAMIQDRSPLVGDPGFRHPGGSKLEDYAPTNARLVKDRGIVIPNIPADKTGLPGGLNLERDIFGNPILGRPDLGAIEMPAQNEPVGSR